jgi:phytoene dehydrogenase-like protein
MSRLAAVLDLAWPTRPADPAMVVHLPRGARVHRWADADRWTAERRAHFGTDGEAFWRWQERAAEPLWRLASQLPPWPPQSPGDMARLAAAVLGAAPDPRLARDFWRPVAAHLHGAPADLRLFVDAQLLIAAQATSRWANALYAAAALDLPRRGVVHLAGGIGAIAETLVESLRRGGGQIRYRQAATRVIVERGRPRAVETASGGSFSADLVVLNLPPPNIAALLGEAAPRRLRDGPAYPRDGWSAFVLHVGLDGAAVAPEWPLHHQVVAREPLGEGNSVFLSVSPLWDDRRAPTGRRALTISTHTRPNPWWQLFEQDRTAYEARKQQYADRLLGVAEAALPGLRKAAELILPGTPVTFERFTGRSGGWVGGFPQTSLLRACSPRLGAGLWQVGDSIFPGQSAAAVALGGMRVARSILEELGIDGSGCALPRAAIVLHRRATQQVT